MFIPGFESTEISVLHTYVQTYCRSDKKVEFELIYGSQQSSYSALPDPDLSLSHHSVLSTTAPRFVNLVLRYVLNVFIQAPSIVFVMLLPIIGLSPFGHLASRY